jgi:hypothetical protein
MSGTQYLSPLLQDPAWQALSRQLSDEARTAIFYLDELWKDERFQQDWTRLKEACFESQREAIAELRELLRKDFRTLTNAARKRVEALFLRGANEHASCLVRQLKEYVPDLIRDATWSYLFGRACDYRNPEAEDEDSNRRKIYAISTENIYASRDPENFRLTEWELVRGFFSGELGELRLGIYYHDREDRAHESFVAFSSKTPFFVPNTCAPLPGESKQDYLKRIKRDLKHELKLLAQPRSHRQPLILPRFLNKLKQLGYEFHNPRNAIPAILALAEDYYEKCDAERRNQVSNRSDATLCFYAKVVYQHKVKGLTHWKEIAGEIMPEGEDLEDWTDRVRKALPVAYELLGLPFEQKGENSENHP